MKNLIIDAAKEKIFFKIIDVNKSYTNEHTNSSENFDKLSYLIFRFLDKNKTDLSEISNIFVNRGPGKYTGIRTSIAVCKAISLAKNINLYGFSSNQLKNNNYNKILDLFKKGVLIRNLIKPIYL
mgnify:CR=1 FL=1